MHNMHMQHCYIQAFKYIRILYTQENANVLLSRAVINSANLQFAIPIVHI